MTCWAVAWSLKVRMLMTAKRARKSPKTEMICAYQRRRIMGMRRTSPIDKGAGSSGSMTGSEVAPGDGLIGGGCAHGVGLCYLILGYWISFRVSALFEGMSGPGIYGDEACLRSFFVALEEEVGGFDGGETRCPRPAWPPSWRTMLEARCWRWFRSMPRMVRGGDFVGVDGLPVAGKEVPLDGGEAKLAGDAEDDGTAGSVGCAEVVDGGAECVFDSGVAAGELLADA